jgi:hypothetical protein
VAGTGECGNELSDSIKCGEFLDYRETVSFSRRTLLNAASITFRDMPLLITQFKLCGHSVTIS